MILPLVPLKKSYLAFPAANLFSTSLLAPELAITEEEEGEAMGAWGLTLVEDEAATVEEEEE